MTPPNLAPVDEQLLCILMKAMKNISDQIPIFTKLFNQIYFQLYFYRRFPLIDSTRGICIASPECLGFGGGVMNPGAILYNHRILVLAKANEQHWQQVLHENNKHCNFMKGLPLLFTFDDHLTLEKVDAISTLENFPNTPSVQIEDFRMFDFNRQIYINHSLCYIEPEGGYHKCEHVLSGVDSDKNSIRFLGVPQLDFPVRDIEKNWVYFERDGELYLLYSFSPYVLLKAERGTTLHFKTVINQEIDYICRNSRFLLDSFVSFSTNPTLYDRNHFLLVVHQRYFSRVMGMGPTFFQWAVLIDRESLLPVKRSSHPIFRGGKARGYFPGTVFVMSTICTEEKIIFFYGEGDSYSSYMGIERSRLDQSFVDMK